LKRALSREKLAVYPEYGETRQRVAAFFGVPADQLLFTNGTDEAIQVLINTYVDGGDRVLVLAPSYAMYRFYAEVAGAEIAEVAYRPADLAFPLEELFEVLTPETRAVLIANPNNPTGTAIDLAGIRRILEKAENAAVLIDEAYFEFFGTTALGLLSDHPNLFVSRTFSKAYGMAGLRLGCLFSQAENILWLHEAQSQYSVNVVAVLAASAAVEDRDYIQRYVAEALESRRLLCRALERMKIPYYSMCRELCAGPLRRPLDRDPRPAAGERRPRAGSQLRDRRMHPHHGGQEGPASKIPRRAEGHPRMNGTLIFDRDGVLFDVSESYRKTIIRTIGHLTGRRVTRKCIQRSRTPVVQGASKSHSAGETR